jgi:GntR family transcriptional regulator
VGQPAYEQVADDLRSKIASGVYPDASTLPSTSQLMIAYGVSSTVVKAAIRELRTAGLVHTQQGKGVFVTNAALAHRQDLSHDVAALTEEIRNLKDRVSRLEQAPSSHASKSIAASGHRP